MDKSKHVFDVVNEWALCSDDKINAVISEETITILQQAVDLLTDDTVDTKTLVTQNNFVPKVHEMRKLCMEGSRAFGDALIEASEFLDNGLPDEAKEIYKQFLLSSKMPFYRNIAQAQLRKIP